VKQNNVEACAWLYLAAGKGQADAGELLATLSQTMTPELLQDARQRADTYYDLYAKQQQ
jgi:hypothetical protein